MWLVADILWLLRELLLQLLVLACMTAAAGALAMLLHGVLVFCRLGGSRSLSSCITQKACLLAVASLVFTALLLTQTPQVPWDRLITLALLVATAPAVLTFLGPPDEHVQSCHLCQIGKGFAYNHHYGYLRLMQGEHGVRKRLKQFKRENWAGMLAENPEKFFSEAVIVLTPVDGEYPSDWDDLKGVGKRESEVRPFTCTVGGNQRSYGTFAVHEVTSSSGGHSRLVALDKVGALQTLQKLHLHNPTGLSGADCKNQMKEMIKELELIVKNNNFLCGQLKVVKYDPEEHVGDAILAAIED